MASSEKPITTSEIIYSMFSGAVFGAVVLALIGYQYLDNQLLDAQLLYAETGDATKLMALKQSAWDQWVNFSLLGAALGMGGGLVNLAGVNAARNASTERSCPHSCPHHHAV